VGLAWLKTLDMTLAWPIKVKDRFTIEPSVSAFNLLNYANFDAANNRLGGVLNGAAGEANGTTAANRAFRRCKPGSDSHAAAGRVQKAAGRILVSMKDKISVTLSREVLAGMDRLAGSKQSRSAVIERVLRRYLRERERVAVQARDLERINTAADRLNSEAADVLEYQAGRMIR
jgi:hypothetical protein